MAQVAEEAAAAWPGFVLLHYCQTFHWVSESKSEKGTMKPRLDLRVDSHYTMKLFDVIPDLRRGAAQLTDELGQELNLNLLCLLEFNGPVR